MGPMIITSNQLRLKLEKAFSPQHLEVMDDSHLHQGHKDAPLGGGSHFTVTIVTEAFNGLSRVERHRRVYALFDQEFSKGLHALKIIAKTPAEV
jgi:BolA protein